MKSFWVLLAFATAIEAQSTITVCVNYASTVTFTAFETFYSTCRCSSKVSSEAKPTYTFATTTGAVVLPDGILTPTSFSTLSITRSNSQVLTTSATASSVLSSQSTFTSTSQAALSSSYNNTTGSTTSSTNSASTATTIVTFSTESTPSVVESSTSSSSTSLSGPVVTDQAYINTILRHHNIHRLNHTANPVVWSTSLADTAREIASSCSYGHVTNINGGGYGQNIGAGYLSTEMGLFVTEGLYNGEVNNYVYYGQEPDLSTLSGWGHFSQIVWKNTQSVGCHTRDCSSGGLANVAANIPPFFTVCNYAPPGNVVGGFAANIGTGVGWPSVHQNYGCADDSNCI